MSVMVFYIHSNASYLSETRSLSQAGGDFFLRIKTIDQTKPTTTLPPLNGPIHTLSKILYVVVGSAAEAKIVATYVNGEYTFPIITTLIELGNPQPSTPFQVYNTTEDG